MTQTKNDKIRSKILAFAFCVYLAIAIVYFVWDGNRVNYDQNDLVVVQNELQVYQQRKALYLKLRPDTTILDRALEKEEIDKLRTLTTILNQDLSHQFDYYSKDRSYRDYNQHVISNLDYHIEELSGKWDFIDRWLPEHLEDRKLIDKYVGKGIKWCIAIFVIVHILVYLWRMVDWFKEGYYDKENLEASS